jgi:hypothetical protein
MYPALAFTMIAISLSACAATKPDNRVGIPAVFLPPLPVKLQIIGDNSGNLPEFPIDYDPSHYRAYIQASRNERYQLRVSNNSDKRVGVVLAVDGRNIISGQKSYLQNTERMYILEAHSSADYNGWRTSSNQTNRFYFTEDSNSYAAAWGDTSAMGVIAMAVYAEQLHVEQEQAMSDRASNSAPAAAIPKKREAGTGFGENAYSPTITVSFAPQPIADEKVFLKYEWREDLCQKRIITDCQTPTPNSLPQNRFWPDHNGFAPPPPR